MNFLKDLLIQFDFLLPTINFVVVFVVPLLLLTVTFRKRRNSLTEDKISLRNSFFQSFIYSSVLTSLVFICFWLAGEIFWSVFLIALVGYFFLQLCLYMLIYYFQFGHAKNVKKRLMVGIKISLVPVFLVFILQLLLTFFVLVFDEVYDSWLLPGGLIHEFNAHVRELCIDRDDLSECPRTIEELRAYNPKKFDELGKVSDLYYVFDDEDGEFFWLVELKDGSIYLSNTGIIPGPHYYTIATWPPAFDGPWVLLEE